METLSVRSAAFAPGRAIPRKYTADGENASPPLSWSPGPAGTKSYALVVDDPDAPAGTWVHWVAWNLDGNEIAENAGHEVRSRPSVVQGRNSWRRRGYGGPSPPSGTHRYFFRVFALDEFLAPGADAGKEDLERAMRGHVLAWGETVGRYARAR